MAKNNPTQLEMFQSDGSSFYGEKSAKQSDPLRLNKVRACQKAIYILVTFIISCAISFSLGVEKGKRSVARLTPEPYQASVPAIAVPDNRNIVPKTEIRQPAVTAKQTLPPAVNKGKLEAANYTIQVASISQVKFVDGEINRLKKKGHSAFSLSKGKYSVICIGRFNAREEAQKLQGQLKNSYPDCQIRRL